jgi:DNA modification methylase
MTVTLLRGDALHLPLADHIVDLICTSPPYFGLRSYQDGGQHYAGQIGSEATPAEWVEAMLAATREMVRVLKPCGSIWVNLGDKYSQYEGVRKGHGRSFVSPDRPMTGQPLVMPVGAPDQWGVKSKSLIGLPWRYALACIDQLGLILRAEVIWSKPNGLPESVTDRVRRSHEQWFHFVVQPRYFSAVDEIREPHTRPLTAEQMRSNSQGPKNSMRHGDATGLARNGKPPSEGGAFTGSNPLGKLPGSVWTVPSQPLTVPPELGVDHFAAFPMEWPRRLIGGWSPAGICSDCGEGRRPVSDSDYLSGTQLRPGFDTAISGRHRTHLRMGDGIRVAIIGYVCACPDTTAPTTPAVVLDGFGGTGTVALVAHVMGRHGISVDLSQDYCRLAAWRTSDPGQLAQAAQVDKPPAQVTGQATLFEEAL